MLGHIDRSYDVCWEGIRERGLGKYHLPGVVPKKLEEVFEVVEEKTSEIVDTSSLLYSDNGLSVGEGEERVEDDFSRRGGRRGRC